MSCNPIHFHFLEHSNVTSIDQLVRQNLNPFDPTTFKPGNFWKETQDENQEVSSIHQEIVNGVERALDDVSRDRKTRTLMLLGDSGSGKSYLLGRLKRRFNDKACFAYVGPWPDSQFIWRHVLRQTVDSLIEVPEGQSEPQLIRWLKGLETLKCPGMMTRLLGERGAFVRDMRMSFPSGLYRPKDFFGVLYELLNPENRIVAYDWLRGEDLDEEDLKLLKVKNAVNSEDAAQKMLGNFGKIADSTQPIVICFDNLDNIPKRSDGKPDLQALFNVNTTIHNEKFKNFLILISIITSNWQKNKDAVEPADQYRISDKLTLRSISLDQAASIWASRLRPLHRQADPVPSSSIAPLTREWLEHEYPGGKVLPRKCLILAEGLVSDFKKTGKMPPIGPVLPLPPPNIRASFELAWQKEFRETSGQVSRLAQFSSPELIRRLQEALEALGIASIQHAILPSPSYKSYSLGYQSRERVGVVWMEDSNLSSFCNVMKACQKITQQGTRDRLYLIRASKLGNAKNKGYQIFSEIFSGSPHTYIKPDIESVHYLETYHRLVNAAAGGELVIASQTPDVTQLQALARQSNVFAGCKLIQQIRNSNGVGPGPTPPDVDKDAETAQKYIVNLMSTHSWMGLQAVVASTQEQVPSLSEKAIDKVIQSLCQTNRISQIDPNAGRENQILCWVPDQAA